MKIRVKFASFLKKNCKLKRLHQIWHIPDHFHWLAPLPTLHRRWLILLMIMLVILAFIPFPSSTTTTNSENHTIPIQLSNEITEYSINHDDKQPVLMINGDDDSSLEVIAKPSEHITKKPFIKQTSSDWQTITVKNNKNIYALLAAHHLTKEDIVALTRIEGQGNPISQLKIGDQIRIKMDINQVIKTITITRPNQKEAAFIRYDDGNFYRIY